MTTQLLCQLWRNAETKPMFEIEPAVDFKYGGQYVKVYAEYWLGIVPESDRFRWVLLGANHTILEKRRVRGFTLDLRTATPVRDSRKRTPARDYPVITSFNWQLSRSHWERLVRQAWH